MSTWPLFGRPIPYLNYAYEAMNMIHVFIINSHAGKTKFSAGLRRHLSSKYSNLEYYIFHTRKKWDERKLIQEIIELFGNEKLRIYCCGGSGTISNAIYGIEDFSNLEFAFYPKGFTNDFLKCFGKDEQYFNDIDELIEGQVINIDYIKTNHGNCLNTFSLGLDSEQITRMDQFRDMSVLGKNMPYALGFAYAVLFAKSADLEIEIEGEKKIIGKSSEVFFGNGGVIGGALWFDPQPCVTDGMGKLVIFNNVKKLKMVMTLLQLSRKEKADPQIVKYDGYVKSVSIKRRDGTSLRVDFDGELQEDQRDWTATVVSGGLPFVVPKGVSFE